MKQENRELFDAARNDQPLQAQAAIDAGADVNARDGWLTTPLHIAAHSGSTDTARLLIDKGADVNARNKYQHTPLHWAARHGQAATARLLIEKGADINALAEKQKTPLDCAVLAKAPDMVALLQEAARKPATHAGRIKRGRDNDQGLAR